MNIFVSKDIHFSDFENSIGRKLRTFRRRVRLRFFLFSFQFDDKSESYSIKHIRLGIRQDVHFLKFENLLIIWRKYGNGVNN